MILRGETEVPGGKTYPAATLSKANTIAWPRTELWTER